MPELSIAALPEVFVFDISISKSVYAAFHPWRDERVGALAASMPVSAYIVRAVAAPFGGW